MKTPLFSSLLLGLVTVLSLAHAAPGDAAAPARDQGARPAQSVDLASPTGESLTGDPLDASSGAEPLQLPPNPKCEWSAWAPEGGRSCGQASACPQRQATYQREARYRMCTYSNGIRVSAGFQDRTVSLGCGCGAQ